MTIIIELVLANSDTTACIRVVDITYDPATGARSVQDVREYPTSIGASYLALNALDYDVGSVIEFRDPLNPSETFITVNVTSPSIGDVQLAQRGFAMLLLHYYGFTDYGGFGLQPAGDPVVTAYRQSDPTKNDNGAYVRVLEHYMRK